MSELYIGLMSGTSVDGIDAVLVDLTKSKPELIATHYSEFSSSLRKAILELCQPGLNEISRLGILDIQLGKAFATAANELLKQQQLLPEKICAIGSHGQTIRHDPEHGFSLQIGDPNIIAAETHITTVADFRRRDLAHGGQGAPLVPAFHQQILSAQTNRVIVNIGGIANITLLPADKNQMVWGFDTGPGNTLINDWINKQLQKPFDHNGQWAATGKINADLLQKLLSDPFFRRAAPKSTGREYFNLIWLEKYLIDSISTVDVQTTLTALTAHSIIDAIDKALSSSEILICGGGVHNSFLMEYLSHLAKPRSVVSTEALGIPPDWMEAMAFAWLAQQTLNKKPGNIPTVTGATKTAVLGGIYSA